MYTLEKIFILPKDQRQRWGTTTDFTITISDLTVTYCDAVFQVTSSLFAGQQWIPLSAIKENGYSDSETVQSWFNSRGDVVLDNSPTAPVFDEKWVHARDVWRANFNVQYIVPGGSPDTNIPIEERTTLLLTHSSVDLTDLHTYGVVTVNGLLHRDTHNQVGLHVLEGGRSVQHAVQNSLGVISFADIGEINKINITAPMINPNPGGNRSLKDGMYITLNEDINNKTVLLSIGGYLHILGDTYTVVNPDEGVLLVQPRRIHMLHQILESRRLMSLATLPLQTQSVNAGVVAPSELWSDSILTAYFELPQSFAIVVDTPRLSFERQALEKGRIPGTYFTGSDPSYPLQTQSGLLPEYWSRHEWGQWVINVHDSKALNYIADTTDWKEEQIVDDTLNSGNPSVQSMAHFLKIGKQLMSLDI